MNQEVDCIDEVIEIKISDMYFSKRSQFNVRTKVTTNDEQVL